MRRHLSAHMLESQLAPIERGFPEQARIRGPARRVAAENP